MEAYNLKYKNRFSRVVKFSKNKETAVLRRNLENVNLNNRLDVVFHRKPGNAL